MYNIECDSKCENRRLRMYLIYLMILLTSLLFALSHFLIFLNVRRKSKGEARDTARVKTIIIEDSESILGEEYFVYNNTEAESPSKENAICECTEIKMEELSVAALAVKTKTIIFQENEGEKVTKVSTIANEKKKMSDNILMISVADVLPVHSSANGQTPQIKIENGCEVGGMTPRKEQLGRRWESIPEISEISDPFISDTDSLSSRIYSMPAMNTEKKEKEHTLNLNNKGT